MLPADRLASLLLLAGLALAPALRAGEDEAGERAPGALRDDAGRRAAAWRAWRGSRTAEEQLDVLRAASVEARRWGVGASPQAAIRNGLAVSGQVWINLGPTNAAYESNGVNYSEVDSGRARKIVPHPTDPNVLFFATSGGGVWKTFDARTPITSTTGPHWTPITESIGSLAIGALALDPRSPETLVLGLGDPFDVQSPGLYTSDDGGVSWSPPVSLTGTYPGFGAYTATSVRDLVFDGGGSGTVIAATDAGLFRSTQGGIGASWTLVDVVPSHSPQDCWSLAWIGGSTWLAACRDGGDGRLYRSTDGGASWSDKTAALPKPNEAAMPGLGRMTLAAAASDSGTPNGARVYLLAASYRSGYGWDQKDVYRSSDGGQSWSSLGMYSQDAAPQLGLVAKPRNPNSDQPDCDVMHDQAWYNQSIQVDPRDRNVVFVGGNLALLRSRSGGDWNPSTGESTWDVIADWLPLSPVIANQYRIPYVHADHHAMAVATAGDPLLPARLYLGTDGGLFVSEDRPLASSCPDANNQYLHCSAFTAPPGYAGTTVPPGSARTPVPSPTFLSKMNRGIVTHLAYSIAADERDPGNNVMMGGLQDNGTRLRAATPSDPNSTVFNQVIGGDGFGVGMGISPSSLTLGKWCQGKIGSVLIGTVYTAIWRSLDCGQSFGLAMKGIGTCTSGNPAIPAGNPCGIDDGSNFYMKIASDFSDAGGLTFLTVINAGGGAGDVWRSTDAAGNWSRVSGAIHLASGGTATQFPGQLRYIGAHPKIANSYLTVTGSRVYATTDGGANWTESAALPRGGLTSAAWDPNDAARRTLWATSVEGGAPSVPHVFRSTDLGASWTAMGGSGAGALPAIPANAVKVDPGDSRTVYLGTEIGLYRTTDGGASWARFGKRLPLVSVTEISVTLDSSAIRVSTFGRGFWEINPRSGLPAGAWGSGDMDRNQQLDAFDLVLQAAELWSTPADPAYDAQGNLVGNLNLVDADDVTALVAKLGGRP